ncbi:COM1 [Fusarium beomiforme]|uniref:COM1 n=1 Tax=Fusarium beomiforme TaxID=44412 RepID=A0A9P5AI39_9HYPO|nr:COM1 [Fusarium beomiforme]
MNSLKVPESGLQLQGSTGKDASLPSQAFALTLNDFVIEDMIKCVQNGDGIQLSLGANPTLLYGSKSHTIEPPSDSNPYDLYLTRPFESTRTAEKIPYTGSLFEKPSGATSKKSKASKADNTNDSKTAKSSKSIQSGRDSDLEALQNGLAAHAASREKARVVDRLPAKQVAIKNKGKLLDSTPRSIPQSPGQLSLGSLTPNPTTSQPLDRAKGDRAMLVHELAVQDRSFGYLSKKWEGKSEDMEPTLRKVADDLHDNNKWSLKKKSWRDLDVWNYDYDTQEVRQKAIDNAVRQYDKQRVTISEPEWDRLLPKEERGTGKSLSRVQAKITKTASTPSINVEMADGGTTPRDSGDSQDANRPRIGGEPMSRSTSNPLSTKPKKPTAQEAQVKRLLGKSKAKTTTSAVPSKPASKASAAKASPTKPRPTAAPKANGGRVLSQAIISNSDSSEDDAAPMAKSKPKAVPKPAPKMRDTVVAKPRPVVREPVKQQITAKRPREDDDSSSSSGTPLSKRIKPKQPLPAPRLKHRPSNGSQNSRGTITSTSMKSKNTSPTKSSPLASSPPTNASDLENEAPTASIVTKKRKVEGLNKNGVTKRPTASSFSDDLVQKAQAFKVCYQKYEALHHEISALDNPSSRKLGHLMEMRDRLKTMKMEIYSECPPERS